MKVFCCLGILFLLNCVVADSSFYEGENKELMIMERGNSFCGDGVCDINESCGDCELDCGICEGSVVLSGERDNLEVKDKKDYSLYFWICGGVFFIGIVYFLWRIRK